MFTSEKAAMLFVLTSCLLPVFSHADDDAHERDADKDRGVQVGRVLLFDRQIAPARSSASWSSAARARSARRPFRSVTGAAALCNSRSTPRKAMKRAPHGRRHPGSDVTLPRTANWFAATTSAICIPPPYSGNAAGGQVFPAVFPGSIRCQRQAHQGSHGAVLHQ